MRRILHILTSQMSKRFRAFSLGRIVITTTDRRSVCINGRGQSQERNPR